MNVDVNINELSETAIAEIKNILNYCNIEKAVILNNTKEVITFYAYNYVDTVQWVPAMHVMVAPNKYGVISASGISFKVHPENRKEEYLASPGRVYKYSGPGYWEEVEMD